MNFSAAADCSAQNNPLTQLNRHTQSKFSAPLHHDALHHSPPSRVLPSDSKQSYAHDFMYGLPPNVSISSAVSQGKALVPLIQDNAVEPLSQQDSIAWSSEFSAFQKNEQQLSHSNLIRQQPHFRPHFQTASFLKPYSTVRSHGVIQQQDINNWDEQFKSLEKEVSENLNITETEPQEYQTEFQKVWDSIQHDADDILNPEEWQTNHQAYFQQEYTFKKNNNYMHNPKAYEIGCLLMEHGAKLSEAALAFEAAVRENPTHVDAWLKLGLVQTQNENEINGINALEKCLQLDPTNLEAMKALAISYINEGYDINSFTMLNRWVETKYPHIAGTNGITIDSEPDRFRINKMVTDQLLDIVNKLPQVDPDVQLCLGLLFYSNDEFDKTIDCFKVALSVNPQDELMWNRLGASLANSNRSEEAIKAYHKALNLKPSFVRARYNLAVSSINLGCYQEAAEHLLTALSMHQVEGVSDPSAISTKDSAILETLKRAFIAMDRNDLLDKVHPGMDLQQFRQEFSF